MAALQKILVPVDGSSPSLAALDHALALAEDGEATIDVLHVRDEPGSFRTLAPDVRRALEEAMEAAVLRAQTRLGARVSHQVRTGDPLREIIEIATEGQFDLIVVGTHGRVGRLHEILGSVAEGVVRNAPCPVLTVREPGSAYQSFAERRHHRPSLSEQAPHHRGA